MKFADLKIGEKFEFSSHARSFCNHVTHIDGPWEKISPMRYKSDGDGKVYRLKTTKIEVAKIGV